MPDDKNNKRVIEARDGENKNVVEKRQSPRVFLVWEVLDEKENKLGSLMDISLCGARIWLLDDIKKKTGEKFTIHITLPDIMNSEDLYLCSEIRWIKYLKLDRTEIGIYFCDLSLDNKSKLTEFIKYIENDIYEVF